MKERASVHKPAMASTKPPSSLRIRERMVRALEASGAIRDARVRRAFLAEPRERYVPEVSQRDGLEAVYRPEAALVTVTDSDGATLSSASAPDVMAPMLEALRLSPGLRVLEIGTGDGVQRGPPETPGRGRRQGHLGRSRPRHRPSGPAPLSRGRPPGAGCGR